MNSSKQCKYWKILLNSDSCNHQSNQSDNVNPNKRTIEITRESVGRVVPALFYVSLSPPISKWCIVTLSTEVNLTVFRNIPQKFLSKVILFVESRIMFYQIVVAKVPYASDCNRKLQKPQLKLNETYRMNVPYISIFNALSEYVFTILRKTDLTIKTTYFTIFPPFWISKNVGYLFDILSDQLIWILGKYLLYFSFLTSHLTILGRIGKLVKRDNLTISQIVVFPKNATKLPPTVHFYPKKLRNSKIINNNDLITKN